MVPKSPRILGALIALLVLTHQSLAQDAKPHKIGWLKLQERTHAPERLKVFIDSLHELGQIEGTNFIIEARYADGDSKLLRDLAEDLVVAGVDVIVATSQPALEAAYAVTRTVPIVARMSDDPVKLGMARSLVAPAGNVTGFFSRFEEMPLLRMTHLHRAVPNLRKVGILLTIQYGDSAFWLSKAREAADKLGIETYVMNVQKESDLETAFVRARENGAGGFLTFHSPVVSNSDARVIELSNGHQLPGIFETRDQVESGGFMSYGPNVQGVFRELAPYVVRILKGDRPASMPIAQPKTFELAINLKAAKAFGFVVPEWVVADANSLVQ